MYANGASGRFLDSRMPERLRVVTEVRTLPLLSDGRASRPDASRSGRRRETRLMEDGNLSIKGLPYPDVSPSPFFLSI